MNKIVISLHKFPKALQCDRGHKRKGGHILGPFASLIFINEPSFPKSLIPPHYCLNLCHKVKSNLPFGTVTGKSFLSHMKTSLAKT